MLDAMVSAVDPPSRKLSLRGRKWRYRGEGNANIVIALPQEREIVRLHKADRGVHQVEEGAEKERVWREVVFCKHVMVPLVGGCYLQPPVAARLDSEEVCHVNIALKSQRPAHRHHKELLCAGGHVTMHPDYALLPAHLADPDPSVPTFCVEVKPKQGSSSPIDRPIPKCTFCMKQYLKLKNQSITRKSSYCPLELFSGDSVRMQTALRALLSTPQNNLRIFKNGSLVYGEGFPNYDSLYQVLRDWFGPSLNEELKLVNRFCCLVLDALTRDLSNGSLVSVPVSCSNKISDFISSSPDVHRSCDKRKQDLPPDLNLSCDKRKQDLPSNCVLDRILRLQMLEQSQAVDTPLSPRSRKDYAYVGALIRESPSLKCPLHRYLLATTAKDCSILIAFQPITRQRATSLAKCHISKDEQFVFNVGVSDLDPKPVSCIDKHRQRDMDMTVACMAALQTNNKPASSPNSQLGTANCYLSLNAQ